MPPSETLLVIGVVGFYLADSFILLYPNEVVFVERYGQWTWSCGSQRQMLRRNPYLPNPLTPDALLFRAAWSSSPSGPKATNQESMHSLASTLTPLRHLVVILFVLLAVGLPLYLYLKLSHLSVILVLSIYGVSLTIASMLWRRRRALGLSPRMLAELAFEAVVCPPLALNVVRKITLRTSLIEDPIAFAQQTLRADRLVALLQAIQIWVNEELEFEDEGSARHQELKAFRARLEQMA
jgi:hypothetical protein